MPIPAFLLLLLALPAISALAPVRIMAASRGDALPSLDAEAACRDVSRMDLNKTDYTRCLAEEQDAQKDLRNSWASFPKETREECLQFATPPALPSYVTLQACLDTRRDAKKLGNNPAGTNLPGTPALR